MSWQVMKIKLEIKRLRAEIFKATAFNRRGGKKGSMKKRKLEEEKKKNYMKTLQVDCRIVFGTEIDFFLSDLGSSMSRTELLHTKVKCKCSIQAWKIFFYHL